MARYLLVEDGIIANVIELDPDNIATSFILNDRGDRLPMELDGVTVSTSRYLVPVGQILVRSDRGDIGHKYPFED